MKAAVLYNYNEPLVVEDIDRPAPCAGEVLVRLGASGVCHSDLHVIKGQLPVPPPTILGHEGAGVVEGVGDGVTTIKVGDHVIAVDMLDRKLKLAETFGATHVIRAGDADPAAAIQELTGGYGADIAFEVIGNTQVIAQAFNSIRRGGKVVVVGVAPVGASVDVPAISVALEEKAVIGSLYGSGDLRRDVPRLIDLYRAGKLKLDELISRKLPLSGINTAFEAMERGEVARSVIVF